MRPRFQGNDTATYLTNVIELDFEMKQKYFSYPEVVEREETLLSRMSSTDFAGRGWPASCLRLPEAADPAVPNHEGRRRTGDSRHLELDLGESNFGESFDRANEIF